MEDRPNCERREFLRKTAAGSVLVSAGVAGCAGSNGGGTDGDGGDGGGSNGGDGSGSGYPSGEIRAVVPYATGGGFDAYTRISEPYWEEYLGEEMSVENITGGGGTVAATQVYNEDPDGYTVMIWDALQPVMNQVGRDVGYDIREMTTIGAMTLDPNCMIAMNRLNLEGWDDFVNRVGEFNFATAGQGTTYHMGVILLGELTGEFSADELNFVHYGGTGELIGGLEKGEADIALPGTTTSGVKIVEALDSELFIVFSDRDTISWFLEDFGVEPQLWGEDLDLPNLDTYSDITVLPRAFFGPPDVPDEILSTQRDAFQQIIDDDEFLQEAEKAGRPVVDPGDHERVEALLDEQFEILQSEPYVSILKDSLG